MKKLNFFLTLLITAFLVTSCEQEKISPDAEGVIDTDEIAADLESYLKSNELLLDEDVLLATLGLEQDRKASGSPHQSSVYTLGNMPGGNEVIAFNMHSNGMISQANSYSTGGLGTGGGLGNQGALALSKSGRLLFVVNPGSNEISFFYVHKDGSLQLMDKIDSGGELPVSITYRHGLIYVLNAGGEGNISGFGFNFQGELMHVSGSTKALSTSASGPAQISFSSNGRALVVTEKATNTISSFPILKNGQPGSIHTLSSAGETPFGFDFGSNNRFYVSEAFGGAPAASTVSSYRIDNDANVTLVDGPLHTNETAACWLVVSVNNRQLFVTNTGSNNVSSLYASGNGQLDFSNQGNTTPALSTPIDAALNHNSKFLYVLVTGTDAIITYRIGANGALTQIDFDDNLPDAATGLVVN